MSELLSCGSPLVHLKVNSSFQVDNQRWFRCKLCPNIRSADISTIMSHVCLTHSLDTVSKKVITKDNKYIV